MNLDKIASCWAQALSIGRGVFANYPNTPDTWKTMCVWFRVFMHELGTKCTVTYEADPNIGVLEFTCHIDGEIDSVTLSHKVTS